MLHLDRARPCGSLGGRSPWQLGLKGIQRAVGHRLGLVYRSAQPRGCGTKLVEGGERVVGEPDRVVTVAFGPLGVPTLEREDPQLGREVRGRIGDAAGDERRSSWRPRG